MKGMLVIISGPSGSGKGTLVKQLNNERYAHSISVTARPMREGEKEGVDYFFRTEEEFIHMRENNQLLEHTAYLGRLYGTPRQYVEEQIDKGKVVILEIEVNGALQVKEKFPNAVLIFLIPPTRDELTKRLIFRDTEDSIEIKDRMDRALEEIELIYQYDYLIINDKIPIATAEIDTVIEAELLKPFRSETKIKKFKSSN